MGGLTASEHSVGGHKASVFASSRPPELPFQEGLGLANYSVTDKLGSMCPMEDFRVDGILYTQVIW